MLIRHGDGSVTIPYEELEDLPETFWNKVNKTDTCWLWTGANVRGYGQWTVAGRRLYVHRLTFSLATGGLIPPDWQVDHLCRTRPCCRPDHLEAVTARENTLRSEGISAVNARKTHCVNGHLFSAENIYWFKGTRNCQTCRRKSTRASSERRKLASEGRPS